MRLLEIVQSAGVLKIDRENGVIRGVKILGRESANNRRYTAEAIRQARPLYEGRVVNCDHTPRSDPNQERRINERFGWLRDVCETDTGLSGDLHFLKSHPMAGQICEAAERNPGLFGLSHDAEGRLRQENGAAMVEEITLVKSVDLVGDPATTRSLFESLDSSQLTQERKLMKKSVREILRAAFSTPARKKLIEQMEEEGMAAPEMAAEVPAEASSDDQIKGAFRAMVMAAFDDESLDSKATLARIKDILAAQEKLTAKAEEAPAEEAAAAESKQAVEAMASVLKELKEIKSELAAVKATAGVQRPLGGQKISESSADKEKLLPKTAKELAEMVRW